MFVPVCRREFPFLDEPGSFFYYQCDGCYFVVAMGVVISQSDELAHLSLS
jgi:hypothetical protein